MAPWSGGSHASRVLTRLRFGDLELHVKRPVFLSEHTFERIYGTWQDSAPTARNLAGVGVRKVRVELTGNALAGAAWRAATISFFFKYEMDEHHAFGSDIGTDEVLTVNDHPGDKPLVLHYLG